MFFVNQKDSQLVNCRLSTRIYSYDILSNFIKIISYFVPSAPIYRLVCFFYY